MVADNRRIGVPQGPDFGPDARVDGVGFHPRSSRPLAASGRHTHHTAIRPARRCDGGGSILVVVNLRLDTDENTEYVPFDHARVIDYPGRIASDLKGLAAGPQNPKDEDTGCSTSSPVGRTTRAAKETIYARGAECPARKAEAPASMMPLVFA
jgi:hypothetical protein